MRRALVAVAAAQLALAAALAGPAHAQWWPFKRKRPEPPPAPTAPAVPQPTVPGPGQLPGGYGVPSGLPGGAPAQQTPEQAAAAAQAADRERYLREARAREMGRDSTAQNAQERMAAWSLVRAIDPGDPEATQGHERARQDLALARQREQRARAQAADSAQNAQLRTQLRGAEAAMRTGDVKTAEAQVTEALTANPDDPQARSLQAAIAQKRRNEELKKLFLILGGGALLGGSGLAFVAYRAVKDARERRRQEAEQRQANVQIIDGVGRGKFVPITNPVFRVGAVASEQPDERNDLVIADADRRVSRHHCTIIRREGFFYLVDASRNGTWLNGHQLERGEQRRLEDGDEVVVADAARIKFLIT